VLRAGVLVVVSWLAQAFFCVYIYGTARLACDDEKDWVWNCVVEQNDAVQVGRTAHMN